MFSAGRFRAGCWLFPIMAVALLCLHEPASASPRSEPGEGAYDAEYWQKANFLAMVPSFVEWPEESSASWGRPKSFQICVFGRYSFGTALVGMTRNGDVHGEKVQVRWVRKLPGLSSCQVVFVSESESKRYGKVLKTLHGTSALTVGETPDFLAAGGMVYLERNPQGLSIDVNLDAASKAKLKISSRLLALARSVLSREAKTGD